MIATANRDTKEIFYVNIRSHGGRTYFHLQHSFCESYHHHHIGLDLAVEWTHMAMAEHMLATRTVVATEVSLEGNMCMVVEEALKARESMTMVAALKANG